VTVQMKLTEVSRDDAHDLIPKIAQFANTQNRVAIADFFANHPFHRKVEEISRRLQVPVRSGARIQSKWFYERARGQFQNERLYLSKSKKDIFDLEFPAEQVINKTELAKYDSTWREKPPWVSLGAQKNFTKFATQFSSPDPDVTESEYWNSIGAHFGDTYYQQIVALAVLWKRAEAIVSSGRGTWYQGDFRPQIVSYALSLLFHSLRQGGDEFDLAKVWSRQGIDSAVDDCIRKLAIAVQEAILNPPSGMTNVGEWAKKEPCWEKVNRLSVACPGKLLQWKISKDDFRKAKYEGKKQGMQDDGISMQKTILDLVTSGYWLALLKWPNSVTMIPASERNLLIKASTVSGFMKINTEKEWRKLLEIRQKCEEEGFRNR
jgi:hypothetical protein